MLELGRCVRHSARPEWGLGVVTKVSATHVEVAFERRALAKITLELASKLVPVERDEIAADSALLDPSRWDVLALEPVVSLTSEGPGFEAGALLWKIHNAVLDDLVRDDHKFFEGLSLASAGSPADGPLYQLSLGS